MGKKLIGIAVIAIMLLGVFGLTGCDKENIEMGDTLKQGVYSTDDEMFRVELYGENSFSLHVMTMSHLPTGSYNVDKGKLLLNYTNDCELVFDIGDNRLTFLGTNTGGQFAEEGLMIVGSVFKLTFYEELADDMIELHTWFFTSGVPNNAIVVKFSDNNAIFECIVDKGHFGFGTDYPKTFTAKPDDVFYWQPDDNIEKAFIEIIIKNDNNIIGYAVIRILQNNGPADHTASVVKSAIFPQVDSKFQNITTEQIETIINKTKGEI